MNPNPEFQSSLDDERYMRRALRLAALGRHASPNPMVGCVLVQTDGRIIGEGYHAQVGSPHAEVNALRDAGPDAARGATAYVTLEPCSHFGKTPPCSDALIAAGISAVNIAMEDPDPRVSGNGVKRLREAGIPVAIGICEAAARELNAAYVKHRTTGLPWIVLKSAMTLDGKTAARTGDSRWITGPISRVAVHRQLRDRSDAIITGVGTVLADDPALTTRLIHKEGRNPLRVIVDSQCRTPLHAQVVRLGANDGKTVIATTPAADSVRKSALVDAGCEIWECDPDPTGRVSLNDLARRMGNPGNIQRILVESGGELAAAFVSAHLVDRWMVYIAPKVVGGASAPGPIGGLGIPIMDNAVPITGWMIRRSGSDLVIVARFG